MLKIVTFQTIFKSMKFVFILFLIKSGIMAVVAAPITMMIASRADLDWSRKLFYVSFLGLQISYAFIYLNWIYLIKNIQIFAQDQISSSQCLSYLRKKLLLLFLINISIVVLGYLKELLQVDDASLLEMGKLASILTSAQSRELLSKISNLIAPVNLGIFYLIAAYAIGKFETVSKTEKS